MTDQIQPGSVISLESAALEFSNAFSLTVARLVTEKLELLEQIVQLRAYIASQTEQHETATAELKTEYQNHVKGLHDQYKVQISELEKVIEGLEREVNLGLSAQDNSLASLKPALEYDSSPNEMVVVNDSYDSS